MQHSWNHPTTGTLCGVTSEGLPENSIIAPPGRDTDCPECLALLQEEAINVEEEKSWLASQANNIRDCVNEMNVLKSRNNKLTDEDLAILFYIRWKTGEKLADEAIAEIKAESNG